MEKGKTLAGRLALAVVLATVIELAGVVPAGAQAAGHNTLPTSGPAARGPEPRLSVSVDPVLAQLDQARKDLEDAPRAYRKARGDEQAARGRVLAPLVEDLAERARAVKEIATSKPH